LAHRALEDAGFRISSGLTRFSGYIVFRCQSPATDQRELAKRSLGKIGLSDVSVCPFGSVLVVLVPEGPDARGRKIVSRVKSLCEEGLTFPELARRLEHDREEIYDRSRKVMEKHIKVCLVSPLTRREREYIERLMSQYGGSRAFRIKQCWWNAQTLTLCDTERRLRYWEGLLDQAIPHAWVTINGKVVDATYEPYKRTLKRRGRCEPVEVPHYLGVRIDRRIMYRDMFNLGESILEKGYPVFFRQLLGGEIMIPTEGKN